MSRNSVRTNKDEKKPIAVRPTHASRSANFRLRSARVRIENGMNRQQPISSTCPQQCPSVRRHGR